MIEKRRDHPTKPYPTRGDAGRAAEPAVMLGQKASDSRDNCRRSEERRRFYECASWRHPSDQTMSRISPRLRRSAFHAP
jgi:hypothetical protein